MASANGFGLTSAASNLGYVYDIGDTTNCYLGEPTTNQFAVLGTPGPGAASDNAVNFSIQGTTGFIRMGYGQTFGGYTIQPGDVVYKYNLGSYGCHYHGNTASIPSGVQATFSFEYYLSPDVSIETNFLANFENYGGNGLGGSIGVPNSTTGVWHKASFTSGPTGGTGTQAMFLYPGGCGGRLSAQGYILYKNPQVEWKAYPTQFVQGTRTSSQSVFDLRNQTGLNMSRMSFTTTPYKPIPIFDGTDDTISTPSNSQNNISGNITMELVLNRTAGYSAAVMHKEVQYTLYVYSNGAITYADSSNWCYSCFGSYGNLTDGVYHHLVATKNGSLVTIYLDGNVVVSQNFGGAISQTNNTLYIGSYDGSSNYFAGYIPVAKVYNKSLTSSEVLNNYQNYKSRFNLP